MKRAENKAMRQTFLIISGTGQLRKKLKAATDMTFNQKNANDNKYERIEPEPVVLLSAALFSAIVSIYYLLYQRMSYNVL